MTVCVCLHICLRSFLQVYTAQLLEVQYCPLMSFVTCVCVYTCLSSLRCSKKEAESQTLLELAEKTLRAHNRSDEIVSFTGASADGTSLSFKEQYRCLYRLVNIFLLVRVELNRMQRIQDI